MTPYERGYNHTMKCAGLFDRVAGSFKALGRVKGEARNALNRRSAIKGLTNDANAALNDARQAQGGVDMIAQQGVRSPEDAQWLNAFQQRAKSQGELAGSLGTQATVLRQNQAGALKSYGKEIAPALGVTAGVGGGGAYLSGDANTTDNQMRRFSNKNFGTNFSTQSRLGAMLG